MLHYALRLGFVGTLVVGCTAIVDAKIASGGIGGRCASSSDCQAGICNTDGVCASTCSANSDCPDTTSCFASQCQKPLSVGAMWVGVSAGGEGWTLTHDEGMALAKESLPYMTWQKKENIVSNDDIDKTIDAFVLSGVNVVIANSFSQRDETLKKADQYPNVKFLVAQSYRSNQRNADSFAAHGEQGWWIAGKVAGAKTLGSTTHRLGYVGSFITPESVRHISAFFLGAKSVDPQVKLEVQWMGFWSDTQAGAAFSYTPTTGPDAGVPKTYFYEQLLTRYLIDHGAVVIGHGADNQRPVKLIEDLAIPGVWSVSNDNANAYKALAAQPNGELLPTGAPLKSCLGSPYWNWAPLYEDLLRQIHIGTWSPMESRNDPMEANLDTSVVGFHLNPTVGVDDPVVKGFINDSSTKGWKEIYQGPYNTTGQRDRDNNGILDPSQAVAAGDTLTDDEYARMCWFPEGIVERTPGSSTDPATEHPAKVPDAAFSANPATADKRAEMTKTAFPGLVFDCNLNR